MYLKTVLQILMLCLTISFANAQTEKIRALTVLIDFPDDHGFTDSTYFFPMFNQVSGYNGFGFNGSVRQYWAEVSNNKLEYTSDIVGWLRAKHNRVNYEKYADGGLDKLVAEVFEQIRDKQFTGLTLRPGTNEIYSVNVIVEGKRTESLRGVAFGMPKVRIFNDGKEAFITGGGNTTTEDSEGVMSLATITHETGHQAFHWPEHYQHISRIGNVGDFCLMGWSGNNRRVNPTPPNPALRLQKGWIDASKVISLNVTQTKTFTATSNNLNQIFKYTNPNNPREYYLIEPYLKQGRYAGLNDEGLAIWYVDEEGGLQLPVKSNVYKVKIMEADGLEEIAKNQYQRGDADDLYDASGKSVFSDFTFPSAKWKDGSLSGLHIKNISAIGPTMSFTVEKKAYTVNATYGSNGKITPSGSIMVNGGASQQFTIKPDIGYEIDQILVNGISVTKSTNYTMSNIWANKSIKVTFKKANVVLAPPSPWKIRDFGTNVQSEVYYQNSAFNIKSYGDDIWNQRDNFCFVYQTLTGDGEIIARVNEQDATSEWAKAGVMIRQSLTDNSAHSFMAITPFQGPAFQHRLATNENSHNVNKWEARTAKWIKLVKSGGEISGYYSSNGTSWIFLGKNSLTANTVYIGLATSSATHLVKKKAVFDNVVVKTTAPNLLAKYNVPRSSAIPNGFRQYSHVHTIGTGGPVMTNVFNSVFNWWGSTSNPNGLYQFTLETSNGTPRHYTNIPDYGSYKLHTSSPEITIGSGIGWANMAGSYWVNFDGNNLVLVQKSGAYALYFSNSSTAPSNARIAALDIDDNNSVYEIKTSVLPSPNPFSSYTEIPLDGDILKIEVYNAAGNHVESLDANLADRIQLGENYPSGIYMVNLIKYSGTEALKIIKK